VRENPTTDKIQIETPLRRKESLSGSELGLKGVVTINRSQGAGRGETYTSASLRKKKKKKPKSFSQKKGLGGGEKRRDQKKKTKHSRGISEAIGKVQRETAKKTWVWLLPPLELNGVKEGSIIRKKIA